MQTANVLVLLGGDKDNTVPKFAVTAAEIAVLRAIHGDEAVIDIEPLSEVQRSNRDERARLAFTYGAAKDAHQRPIVETMFPGVAARVFETLDELELDPSFFKATGRMNAATIAAQEAAPSWDAGLRKDGPTIAEWVAAGYSVEHYPPRGYEARSTPEEIAALAPPAPAAPQEANVDDADDGVGDDIDDEHAEKTDENVLS